MIDNQPQDRGFFATIPGILASLAAVLTAAGGIYLGVHGKDGSQGSNRSDPPSVVVNLPTSGQSAAPTDSSAVNGADLRLSDVSTEVSAVDSADQDLATQCESGDPQGCVDLLDGLAHECELGDGLPCDLLFMISPEGSDYESYGATCGGRFDDVSVAGACEEQ